MTRLFLAAGVAALAIAAPASAGPHGGGRGNQQAHQDRGGGGGGRPQVFARGGGGGHAMRAQGFSMPRQQRPQRSAVMQRQPHAEHVRMQTARQHAPRERMQTAREHAPRERMQAQAARQQQVHRGHAQNRMAARQQMRASRMQAQNQRQVHANRVAQSHQMHAQRLQQARNMRLQRFQQAQTVHGRQQNRMLARQQLNANRINRLQTQVAGNGRIGGPNGVGFGVGGCPPGLISKGCMPPGLANKNFGQLAVNDRINAIRSLGDARFLPVANFAPRREIFAPVTAAALIGVPLATAATFGTFSPFPQDLAFLYPATPNYYYQYGNGYAFEIDRGSNLIAALIPLLAGGFLPGSYLPPIYMSSFVPGFYGFNSFYPASFDYGFGYGNLCNRYAYGVVYQVDCFSGLVENVIPLYAGGYGVGQLLPSAYNYYNVPLQYRSLYYPTADYSYWYAPGAIYQYDTRSSLITSVAALMTPGFAIGQPLPVGYGMYNVPLAYRATYYDTPNAWYRYNNGYIYRIDPATQLVTAVVASLLT